MTLLRIAAVLLGLCSFAFVSPASAKDDYWTPQLWGDPGFDEELPTAFVDNGPHLIAVRLMAPDMIWVVSVKLDIPGLEGADVINSLLRPDGSRLKLTVSHASDAVMQSPTSGGGLLTTFAVSYDFIQEALTAKRWIASADGMQVSFSLVGFSDALDTVEMLANDIGHTIAQAESDREQALARCAEQVAHPYDSASAFDGVAWDDIDAEAAIDACDWALSDDPGNPQLMYLMGRAQDKAGRDAAVHWLTEAASDGYAMAQYHLGYLYLNGEYVSKDVAVARNWFEQGAEQDNLPSQYELANLMIDSGDNNQWYLGMKMMQRSANEGYPFSQWKFGWYLENGDAYGSEAPEEAREYYQRAADANHADGQYALARMYRDGIGGDADSALYLSYLRKAADQGNSKARKELGLD